MSEQENQPPSPPRPTVKTSAVPLKKETVRITLRPQGPGADAPPPPPPPGAATSPIPPAPTAPAPPAPRPIAPTVPLAPPPRPVVPGAPSSAAPRPAPPSAPIGAKTIPLSQPPRPTTPVAGKPTGKIAAGTPTTQPLPRATVKLQPTATPSASISSVNVRTTGLDDEEDEVDEGPLNIMGWVGLAGAIAAVLGVLMCWDKVEFFSQGTIPLEANATQKAREEAIKSWNNSPKGEGMKLNADFSPFDRKTVDGGVDSDYARIQPKTPQRPADPYTSN
jgi:hypothetical protein